MIKTSPNRLAYIKSWQKANRKRVNESKMMYYFRNKNKIDIYSSTYGKGYRAGLNRGAEAYKQSLIQWLEGEKRGMAVDSLTKTMLEKHYGLNADGLSKAIDYNLGHDEALDKVINHIKEQKL